MLRNESGKTQGCSDDALQDSASGRRPGLAKTGTPGERIRRIELRSAGGRLPPTGCNLKD
jgi:hypothetical protein